MVFFVCKTTLTVRRLISGELEWFIVCEVNIKIGFIIQLLSKYDSRNKLEAFQKKIKVTRTIPKVKENRQGYIKAFWRKRKMNEFPRRCSEYGRSNKRMLYRIMKSVEGNAKINRKT